MASESDHLNLRVDAVFMRMLQDEVLTYSNNTEILTFDYQENALKGKASAVIVVTSEALYIFAPPLNGQLIYNAYDRFPLEQILLISLPYENATQDVALRTEDFCIHMHDARSLWIRSASGQRSELLQAIADGYQGILHSAYELELNQTEYEELIKNIASGEIRRQVFRIKCQQLSKFPPLKQGWMGYRMIDADGDELETLVVDDWPNRWFVLTRNDLWHFLSQEEADAYKFVFSTPETRRASLPKFGCLSLGNQATARVVAVTGDEVAFKALELKLPEERKVYYMKVEEDEQLDLWRDAVERRPSLFIELLKALNSGGSSDVKT